MLGIETLNQSCNRSEHDIRYEWFVCIVIARFAASESSKHWSFGMLRATDSWTGRVVSRAASNHGQAGGKALRFSMALLGNSLNIQSSAKGHV